MEQNTFIGMAVAAIVIFIGIYKFIDDRAVKRTEITNDLRQQQIEATHEQTLATRELSSEIKSMRKDLNDLETRTTKIEDIVLYKKDRVN